MALILSLTVQRAPHFRPSLYCTRLLILSNLFRPELGMPLTATARDHVDVKPHCSEKSLPGARGPGGALAEPRAVSLKMKPLTATARVEKIDQNLKQPFSSKKRPKMQNPLTATAREFRQS